MNVVNSTVQPLLDGNPRGNGYWPLNGVKTIDKPSSGLWLLAA